MKVAMLVVVGVCAVLGIYAVFFYDEPLDAQAVQWLQASDADRARASKAFLYSHGIDAAQGEDVLASGQAWFDAYQNTDLSTVESVSQYDLPNALPVFCQLWKSGCIQQIMDNHAIWKGTLDSHRELLTRYTQYLNYDDYRTLSKPGVDEKLPDYQYMAYGNRLTLLSALVARDAGKMKEAVGIIYEDIARLRLQLVMADNLVHKMLFTMLIANDLDILVHVTATTSDQNFVPMPLLSVEERTFAKPLAREFVGMHTLFMGLHEHPNFFDDTEETSSWYARAVFKPHMTLNKILARYSVPIALSQLEPEQLAKALGKARPVEDDIYHPLNVVGDILANVGSASYESYVARLYDLNCKIALANHALSGGKNPLVNPYIPNRVIDTLGRGQCLSGPLEDKRRLRCLNVSIGNDAGRSNTAAL